MEITKNGRLKASEEELDFITTCINKILYQKKLDYLEVSYIHLLLSQKEKHLEAEIKNYKKMGV